MRVVHVVAEAGECFDSATESIGDFVFFGREPSGLRGSRVGHFVFLGRFGLHLGALQLGEE